MNKGGPIPFSLRRRSVILSVDWDYAFFYPDISGTWKRAYERAVNWLFQFLSAKGLKATMFVTPENARLFPHHVERIIAEGHPLGLHIHSIMADTPRQKRRLILEGGTKCLEDAFGRRIRTFRGGMFYVDRDMVDDLAQLGYQVDSSLVPDRQATGDISGPLETRAMKFNQPTDFRGFPAHPYFLKDNLLEVPPSRYCMDYFATGAPRSMIDACLKEPTRLSVIYLHPKNVGGRGLKESAGGQVRRVFTRVVDALLAADVHFLDYAQLRERGSFPVLKKPYQLLPR